MKTNKQSKIKIPQSGFKRSKFNWTHDVNTTFTWGEIQPTQCKLLIPGSKTTMATQELVRLAPMVAPTFGRVKYKTYNQFVPLADVFPNFDSMMAQEPINRVGIARVPQKVPTIKLAYLSAYAFFGARATLYWADGLNATARQANAEAGIYKTSYRHLSSDLQSWTMDADATAHLNRLVTAGVLKPVFDGIPQAGTQYLPNVAPLTGYRINLCLYNMHSQKLDGLYYTATGSSTNEFFVPISAENSRQLIPVDRAIDRNKGSVGESTALVNALTDVDYEVTFDGADYVIEFSILYNNEDYYYAIAFDFSDYGKRMRKILQGCGYQLDISSSDDVSILPLLAQYKAYWDVFGLTLYQNWETTSCAKLINVITSTFAVAIESNERNSGTIFALPTNYTTNLSPNQFLFIDFMMGELANEWYTEAADYIGAHLPRLNVSPKADLVGADFITVDNTGIASVSDHMDNNATVDADGVTDEMGENQTDSINYPSQIDLSGAEWFIDRVHHGAVDSKLLMRMYRWTNRNSILGRAIAALLRAQGLGDYVEECKSNYIGATDNMVTISDVVSMADTSDGSSGALLGEYGGKGLQYVENSILSFENDVYGYWITLATIVPEAGYVQGLDPVLSVHTKMQFYHPDFDAIGMEPTPKTAIAGATTISNLTTRNSQKRTFGFVPRYSRFKVAFNLVNGDFNRHNMRSTYLPYTLDKQINVNDFSTSYDHLKQESQLDSSHWSVRYAGLKKSIDAQDLPVAGNIWRTPTKYAWLGNFNRIFANIGSYESDDAGNINYIPNAISGYSDFNNDNFLSHAIYIVNTYAPMKPIEDSYGLDDDDNDGIKGVDFKNKA